ncbi:MAG TPA: TRAP transporter substrate-binding protein [Acidimicrobiia bacterium]|nr:TRAP transporter substrate-binding protein [Acidimicrobiia bacterium]
MSTQRLWVGGYGPRESAHGEGLEVFRRVVESETNGEVGVEVTWNIMDDGRPNTDLFELVESGHMFLCYFSSSYLGSRVPELNVLETPFLFDDLAMAHRALDGPLGDALTEAVRASTGFEALGFWDNGFRHLTNRLRPVHLPEDCRGMSVRLQPNVVHEELIRCWGAIPVAVELSHGIQLISRLDVDAQENPLANTVAYGVDQVHGHVTMTGHLYGARGLFAHRPTWEAFPPDLQATVGKAARSAVEVQRMTAERMEADLRVKLEAAGVAFVDLTPEQHAAFVDVSAPAIARAHEGVPGELFDLARS